MRYATYPKPILGPCPCSNCGEPLFWARRSTRVDGAQTPYSEGYLAWREWTGRIHKCVKAKAA